MKLHPLGLSALAALLATAGPVRPDEPAAAPPGEPRVTIDYFYEAGCPECFRIENEVLPALEAAYEGFYVLNSYDIAVQTNYLSLLGYLERLENTENAPVYMIVDQRVVLAGGDAIATRLLPLVDEHLSGGPAPQPLPPPPAAPEPRSADRILVERVEQFTLVSVIIAGLVDGINPCAISTLVFLISVLSLARARGSRLLAVGAAFCLASFLTYSLIGLGLLHAFRALAVFRLLQKAVDAILIALLAGLAFFSFRDAVRFARSHDPHDVSLQLPEGFKVRIHRMMRAGLGRKAQLTTAFGIGAAVTMLESVCTGQVYVPTLAFVVRSGQAVTRGLGYLALYNLMFVLPLVAVFGLTFGGMKVATLVEWSSRNVIFSKLLLGLFFLALAGMMLVL